MIWLYRFICGYVRVLFKGELPEKILNIASANRIFLWDSHLTENGIESNVFVKDFKDMRHILRKSGIRIHILKKSGLPFKLRKNRKRLGTVAGAALFMAFLYFMSGYVWMIEVTGNERVSEKEIVNALKSIGITEGIKKTEIDTKTQREKLLLEIDSLAWAALNIEGCKLTVNVSEIKASRPEKATPSNLIASADGTISKLDVISGNCLVKQGDTVKKGDVLVSGIIERLGRTDFVHSSGKVTAITERCITVTGNYRQKITGRNGKHNKKIVLDVFSLKIPLFLGKETKAYESETKTHILNVFGQKLPIKAHEKTFYYLDEYTAVLEKDKLAEKLEAEIKETLKKEKVENYTVADKKITDTPNGISITVIVNAEENIAVNEELRITSD